MSKVKKFIELVENKTGSKTFCVLPWIHVATRPNGDARLCCGANASQATKGIMDGGLVKNSDGTPANFGKDSFSSSWNNEYMRNVRTAMLSGNVPSSCLKCFEEETNGIVSKRVWETYYWHEEGIDLKKLVDETTGDGEVPAAIRYLDLRLGHTCNLKCVMCSPHDSSRWVQDYDNLVSKTTSKVVLNQISWNKNKFNNTWYERPELWEEIFQQIPNIKQLYFAGGEPLMIKEHRRFLEEIIHRGYADQITVRYNSNGTFVNDDIINIWSKFKEVFFAFSIDAVGERNSYIRFPANWTEIETALDKLDNTPSNIKVSIACAVQVFNIKHIFDFAKWKIGKKFKKINLHEVFDIEAGGGILNMHMIYIPTFLSARILPKEDKLELRNEFKNFKDWLWNNYRQDDDFWKINPNGWNRWESVIKFVEAEDHSYLLDDFREYVTNLDTIRNTVAKKVFPELAHLL